LTRIALALLALWPLAPAHATSTLNFGVHAVPPPKAVVIDGKLDDWDLSGRILICSDVETLRDTRSGEVAFMYDAENLYCAVHFKTPKPMINVNNPKISNFGWAGDSLQLRLVTDKVVSLTGWYYAANKQPHIDLNYGKGNDPYCDGSKQFFQVDGWKLEGGAEMAFLKDADGNGYVQELKLPWALITNTRRYAPGEELTCGIELLWGEGAGGFAQARVADNVAVGQVIGAFYRTPSQWGALYLEKSGNLKLPPVAWEQKLAGRKPASSVKISYQLPTTGALPQTYRVTLAMTDPANPDWIVSQPVCGAVRIVTAENKGVFEEEWNGLDDNFMPLPPGKYGVKGIYMPARKWEINGEYHSLIPKLAAAPGDSWFPARSEEDKLPWLWGAGGNEGAGNIAAVAVAPNGAAAFLSQYMEGDACWLADLNKPINWHQVVKNYYAQGPSTCVATDGEAIWADCFWGPQKLNFVFRIDNAPFGDKPGVNKFSKTYHPDGRVTALAAWRDPASRKRFLYLAQSGNAQDVRVLDGDTAAELARLPLRNPQGLCAVAGQRLVVLHQDAEQGVVVSEVALRDGVPVGQPQRRFAVPGVAFPTTPPADARALFDIQADARGGYYVSDRRGNQVYRLDGTGAVTRRYGRATAQQPGHYDRQVFMSPGKLALWTNPQGQDRLLVVENAFPRVSEWSVEGELLREWILGVNGDGGYCADPERPNEIYVQLPWSDTGRGLARFRVDYQTGAWQVDAVWPEVGQIGETTGGVFPGGLSHPRIVKVQGRQYLVAARAVHDKYGYMVYRRQGDDWTPSAALIPVDSTDPKTPANQRRKWYWWHDANGDGKLQESEYLDNPTTLPGSRLNYFGDTWLDDLSLTWMAGGSDTVWRAAPTGFDKFGNPMYDGKSWTKLLTDTVYAARKAGTADALHGGNEQANAFSGDWQCLAGSMQEGFYVNARGGASFGANEGTQYKISRYVPDGQGGFKMKWRVGRAMYAHGSMAVPGDIAGSIYISPPVNGLFGMMDSTYGFYYIYTTDGLYMDTLFVDMNRYPELGGVFRLSGENFSGAHFLNRDNGKVYVAMTANHPATLFEVEGWTATGNPARPLKIADTVVTLTPEAIAPPSEAAASIRGITLERTAVFAKAPAGGPALDGSLTGWEQAVPITFQTDEQQQVEVRPLYDTDHIYLRFQVRLPRPLGAVAPDGIRDAFTHNYKADTVSFYLQGDPAAKVATRGDNGRPGDVRVVLALVKEAGKVRPAAFALYPKWLGAGPASPIEYTSSVTPVRFEHAAELKDVPLGFVAAPDQKQFTIAIALPRAALAPLPPLGPEVKTTVNFEATLGGHNKFWWANMNGAANRETYDVPTEARLYPAAWGKAEFR
jgi:hypothetical protein